MAAPGPFRNVCVEVGVGIRAITISGGIMNSTILWVIAAVLVIVGIVQLIQGQIIFGIVLIVAGCIVGPGGYSIFRRRN
jgi:hypothetical protein